MLIAIFVMLLIILIVSYNICFSRSMSKIYPVVQKEVSVMLDMKLQGADPSHNKDFLKITNAINYIRDQIMLLRCSYPHNLRVQCAMLSMFCVRAKARIMGLYQNEEGFSAEEKDELSSLRMSMYRDGIEYTTESLQYDIIRLLQSVVSCINGLVRGHTLFVYYEEEQWILCRIKAAYKICQEGMQSINKEKTEYVQIQCLLAPTLGYT
ncbi:putative lipoprotein [Ehrlichia chaffeensis str. Heartland]|nr:putative lipoprotein [Ehrlichia chaffeensis str. Heartland]AHX05885.1 putative lipoprotein [Ehrlichia chaffeensis str. Jax]AHX06876.1 putative lipoprotein [Ehrlichia chaffeensis str. Liberty]AHX07674.1 putative lipoprotein [Ehrlichia chaffeensis str. Osceola]AHX08231.1 putative lipoprotein [Ehrlichia chaffeensis str. Saint Vincent]AHX09943.1 putative lipoprotein [Ehrlichia chaffeensis str. Wakulla]AHX10601.1 putative lipoprotein [Ehrlichia chaffeensis str. West Paces]